MIPASKGFDLKRFVESRVLLFGLDLALFALALSIPVSAVCG